MSTEENSNDRVAPRRQNPMLLETLQRQIEEQRKDQTSQASYTQTFLECLIRRHDLPNMIAHDQRIEGTPTELLDQLKNGSIPEKTALSLLSVQEQEHLVRELIWICGHGAIRWYREQGLSEQGCSWEPETSLSRLQWSESYIHAALALLTSSDPSMEFLHLATSRGHTETEKLQHNLLLFAELQAAILCRHEEDKRYARINY